MSDYTVLEVLLSLLALFFITFLVPFYFLLDGIRYFRYGKLFALGQSAYIPNYKIGAIISILFGFFFFLMTSYIVIFLFLDSLLIFFLWIVFLFCFFYWYWHTEKDPFHYEQKVWQDPRDKKKS